MFKFEDIKDEIDQEFSLVPEEHEEDPPLRLKSTTINADSSPVKVARIDFH